MLKEIFDDGFEKFKIFKGDLMAKVVYLVQMLLALIGGRCNHFGDIQKKFSGYLILICSFRLC